MNQRLVFSLQSFITCLGWVLIDFTVVLRLKSLSLLGRLPCAIEVVGRHYKCPIISHR